MPVSSYNGQGPKRLGGTASINQIINVQSTGGTRAGGSSDTTLSDIEEVSGGSTCGGSADVSINTTVQPMGGVICGGSSDVTKAITMIANGKLIARALSNTTHELPDQYIITITNVDKTSGWQYVPVLLKVTDIGDRSFTQSGKTLHVIERSSKRRRIKSNGLC